MKTISFAEHLTFPESMKDHASFRHWVTSEGFPDNARVSYLDGDRWVDLTSEQIAGARDGIQIEPEIDSAWRLQVHSGVQVMSHEFRLTRTIAVGPPSFVLEWR